MSTNDNMDDAIDFSSMSEADLKALKNRAIAAGEKPNKFNNYCTFKRSKAQVPQPADWTPTTIQDKWCPHHGPSKHSIETCHMAPTASTSAPKTAAPAAALKKSKPSFLDPAIRFKMHDYVRIILHPPHSCCNPFLLLY
jgi:hypothetical protein